MKKMLLTSFIISILAPHFVDAVKIRNYTSNIIFTTNGIRHAVIRPGKAWEFPEDVGEISVLIAGHRYVIDSKSNDEILFFNEGNDIRMAKKLERKFFETLLGQNETASS